MRRSGGTYLKKQDLLLTRLLLPSVFDQSLKFILKFHEISLMFMNYNIPELYMYCFAFKSITVVSLLVIHCNKNVIYGSFLFNIVLF